MSRDKNKKKIGKVKKDKKFDQRIYELGLHGQIFMDDIQAMVTRVPGGWVYHFDVRSPFFVPFDKEFQTPLGIKTRK